MDKKIFIIGASGFIGSALFKQASQLYSVLGTSTTENNPLIKFNLVEDNFESVFILAKKGDYAVITSAISSPDRCSQDFDYAQEVNIFATEKLISKFLSCGVKVIFLSSDAVYGSADHDADENDLCNPIGSYGKMKFAVEKSFSENKNFKSIRLSYVFSMKDKFTSYLLNCISLKISPEVYHPFIRSVVCLEDVILGILNLINDWNKVESNIINFAGPLPVSRVDIANKVFSFLSADPSNIIIKTPESSFFSERPQIIKMKCNIFSGLLGRKPLTIDSGIDNEFKKYRGLK